MRRTLLIWYYWTDLSLWLCYLFTFLSFYDLSPPGEDGDGYGVADETQDPDQVEKNSWSCCCFAVRSIITGYMQLWKIRNVMSKGQNQQLAIKSWMLVLQERCMQPTRQPKLKEGVVVVFRQIQRTKVSILLWSRFSRHITWMTICNVNIQVVLVDCR